MVRSWQPRWGAARARLSTWAGAHPYRVAAAVYVVLSALFVHDWDGYVFATSVRQLWGGQTPYEVATTDPWYGYLNVADEHVQWYAYPPVPLLAMAASGLLSVLAPLPPILDRVLLKLPMVAGTLALAYVAGRWARRLGGDETRVRHIERRFLTNPFLVLVGPVWGMTDTGLMALCMAGLLAYAGGRPWVGGALVALSALVKPFPILLLVPLVPYFVRRDGWANLMRFVGAGAATAAVVCAPFILGSPQGFWRQAVGGHLARDPQGLTLWSLWPLHLLPGAAITFASLAILAILLLAIGWTATRLAGRGTTLVLLLASAVAVLVANRVVNEQYLVLVVAPLLVLDVAHRLDRFAHIVSHVAPSLFAAAIVLVGFHFLTFIPPDLALPLFGRPVDVVAHEVRTAAPGLWRFVDRFFAIAVPLAIALLGVVAYRILRRNLALAPAAAPSARRGFVPTAAACLVLGLLALPPVLQSGPEPTRGFEPALDGGHIGAFYYLWWQNPAHDPAIRYGNWEVVSQVPTMGYYTNTRGVAREHAQAMLEAGIDTAIVSYHRGELERYRVFQEEAGKAGLYVTPLIELNQVYDQAQHHPIRSDGRPAPYAAYRLDDGTRQAIVAFVLDLADQLPRPSTLRIDGAPVLMFYDSYVSAVSYHPDDQRSLANTLLGLVSLGDLRTAFNDTGLDGSVESMLRHYPPTNDDFYREGSASLWRLAHLEEHRRFWVQVRQDIEAAVGPVHLISGDAVNERAGFEAGTVKLLVGLEVFDGAFIYSPSFTWGNQPAAPFNDTFALWEDRNHWLTSFARASGATSSFGIAPAYDDTVNRPHGFVIDAFPANVSGSFYDLSWASTLAEPPTFAAIATFNEYFEGSSIESSREYGAQFMDATAAARTRLESGVPARRDIGVVLHERSSRTSAFYAETDLSHFWGLDLLAATVRVLPQAQVSAYDGLEPNPAPVPEPDLLLVEGGRGQFALSPAMLERLDSWRDLPRIVFGSDAAIPLAILGDLCLEGLDDPADPSTLVLGDVLRSTGSGLELERGGTTYLVGQACPDAPHAATSIKPWVATDPIRHPWGGAFDELNRQCLAVTLRALAPAFAPAGAPETCTVPDVFTRSA